MLLSFSSGISLKAGGEGLGSRGSLPLLRPRMRSRDRPARPHRELRHRRRGEQAPPSRSGFSGRAALHLPIRSRLCPSPPPNLCRALNHGAERIRLADAREAAAPAPRIARERAASCSARKSCTSFPETIAGGREAPAFPCSAPPKVRSARMRALCGQC